MTLEFENFILAVQIFSCFSMTGLIWLIQLVHYPGFQFANRDNFPAYHRFHSARITWIVGPLMLLELISAGLLAWTGSSFWIVNFIGVLSLWGLTALVSVPIHNQLASVFDLEKIQRLTSTNWYRTVIWTWRSLLILWMWTP